MQGWIKINRSIVNHWLWQDAERLKWWLDLLLMVSWEDKQVLHDSHLFTLQRGQMIASISSLVNRWGKNRNIIIKYLKQLEEDGMIERKVMYRQTSILTICNYERYQLRGDTIRDTIRDRQIDENARCNSDGQKLTVNIYESANLGCHENNVNDTIRDTIRDPIANDINKEYKEYKELINNYNNNARAKDFKIEDMKSENIWLETMAMRYNLSSTQEVIQWIDVFALDVQCREITHANRSDMKRHFCDWLRIQLSVQNERIKRDTPRASKEIKYEDLKWD